ncbi:hypothetical protein [Noviherbaspirillum sp.]|jgi:hypothetical protein|uniref:hypothetical protein n=1 Tax=Noviherbaspirillum sp. TaxID=1926288 RepID=UPI0025EF1AE0|nr:hypothetical protein [Noviherbaspirillum sp.]
MKANLKSKLLALPLLACSAWAFADGPITLDAPALDGITAGAQSVIERIADVLATIPRVPGTPYVGDLLTLLGPDRMALLTQLASGEPITFRLIAPGELVATQQLPSGEQLVLVRQLNAAEASTLRPQAPGDTVSTYLLKPGESLNVQQSGSAGTTNYLFINGTGNTSVTSTQRTAL